MGAASYAHNIVACDILVVSRDAAAVCIRQVQRALGLPWPATGRTITHTLHCYVLECTLFLFVLVSIRLSPPTFGLM